MIKGIIALISYRFYFDWSQDSPGRSLYWKTHEGPSILDQCTDPSRHKWLACILFFFQVDGVDIMLLQLILFFVDGLAQELNVIFLFFFFSNLIFFKFSNFFQTF